MAKSKRKKKSSGSKKSLTVSAFSTGGGGNVFEQRVATFYLAALLLEAFPYGHDSGVAREVRLQRRFVDGDPLDDIVVLLDVPEAPQRTARLSLQLKHDLEWGDNPIFDAVLRACWEAFTSPEFHFGFDRFGIGVGIDKATYRSYKIVLQQAQQSATAADFLRKIDTIESNTCRQFVRLIRGKLNAYAVQDGQTDKITDEDIWKFFRSLVLLPFDLMDVNSRDAYQTTERLRLILSLKHPRKAKDLWEKLFVLAAAGNPFAASFTRDDLIHKLKLKGIAFSPPAELIGDSSAGRDNHNLPSGIASAAGSLATVADDSASGFLPAKFPDNSTQRVTHEARLDAMADIARDLMEAGRIEDARAQLLKVRQSKEFPLSAALQFRVAANLGACAFEMDDMPEAARECRTAYRQQPRSVKGMVVGAQAEFLDGKPQEAITLCEEALRQEPRYTEAALIYVQALHAGGRDDDLEEFLKRELWVEDAPNCAYALAHVRSDQGQVNEAIRLLEAARAKEPNNPEISSQLGYHLIRQARDRITGDPPLLWRTPQEVFRSFETGIEALSVAIRHFEKHDNKRHLLNDLANRAAAYGALDRHAEGLKDCARVLLEDENHQVALLNKGWILLKQGDDNNAIEALSKVQDERWKREATRSLALAHLRQHQWQEVADSLSPFLNPDAGTPEQFELVDLWLLAQTELGQQATVQEMLDTLEAKFPGDPEFLQIKAHQRMREKRGSEAVEIMRQAVSLASGRQKNRMTATLAEMFFWRRRYTAAVPVFREIVDENYTTEFLLHYVIALFRSRSGMSEAFRIAQKVRGNGKAVPGYSEIEAHIADRAGDWKLAIRLRRELAEQEPRKAIHRIRLAVLEFSTGNVAVARQVLRDIPPEAYEGDPELMMEVARARALIGVPGALDVAYRARRAQIGSSELHYEYISIFHQSARDDDPLLSPAEARADCVLRLQVDGEKVARILVEGEMVLPEEVSIQDPRGRDMVGRRVGDEVVIKKGMLGDVTGIVTEVQHKFVYAFQDSIERFKTGEVWHRAMDAGQVDDPQKFLDEQAEALKRRRRHDEELAEMYRSQSLPLSSFASLHNRPVIELWSQIGGMGGRFYVADGNLHDILQQRESLRGHGALILDPTALCTIALLEIEEAIKRRFPRLIVAHAVWEEFKGHQLRQKLERQPSGYLWSDGLRIYYREITREEIEKEQQFLERIVNFIEKSTEILPVYSIVDQGTFLLRGIGESTLASILLARERKLPLYSDDARVRHFAALQHEVNGTYIWPILSGLRPSGLSQEQLFDALCRLVLQGYTFINITKDVLLHFLKKNGMNVNNEARFILHRTFSNTDSNLNWAASHAAHFIAAVWQEKLLVHKYRQILHATLEAYFSTRPTATALHRLKDELKAFLLYDPVTESRITRDVDNWHRANLHLINQGALLEPGKVKVAPIEISLHIAHPAYRRR